MNKPRVWALVPAAGSGTRFGSQIPKQYCEVAGKPIVSYVLETLASIGQIQGIAVGLAKEDRWWSRKVAGSYNILGTYTGGCSRAETVLRGLEFLEPFTQSEDWVLVHDAARPCIQAADIELLIRKRESWTSGVILAVPISDTVKRSNGQDLVSETVSRETLWYAQTPQLFSFVALRNALQQCDLSLVTDEASAMEVMGYRPRLVQGRVDNIKVTTAEDFDLAVLILSARNRGSTG